jgi:hypothetical protein
MRLIWLYEMLKEHRAESTSVSAAYPTPTVIDMVATCLTVEQGAYLFLSLLGARRNRSQLFAAGIPGIWCLQTRTHSLDESVLI